MSTGGARKTRTQVRPRLRSSSPEHRVHDPDANRPLSRPRCRSVKMWEQILATEGEHRADPVHPRADKVKSSFRTRASAPALSLQKTGLWSSRSSRLRLEWDCAGCTGRISGSLRPDEVGAGRWCWSSAEPPLRFAVWAALRVGPRHVCRG